MRHVGGEIPSALAQAFTEAIEALGLVKKRAIAAAIAAWLRADSQTQIRQYHEVFELYYQDGARPPSVPREGLSEEADRAMGPPGKRRKARHGA